MSLVFIQLSVGFAVRLRPAWRDNACIFHLSKMLSLVLSAEFGQQRTLEVEIHLSQLIKLHCKREFPPTFQS